jgi:galactonate dehydratase
MSKMKKSTQPASFYGVAALSDIVRPRTLSNGSDFVRRSRRAKLETSAKTISIPETPEGDLTIIDIRAWILREPVSERGYTIIKIRTASGMVGFGECAPLRSSEFAEAKRLITGKPVTSFNVTASLLSNCTTARAALNIAMLDVVGKACKVPVFQLLGGPTRHKVRALAQLSGDTETDLINSMNKLKGIGYKAFIVPIPAVINRNQGQAYVLATRKRLEALRTAGGEDVDFVLDGASLLSAGDAQMISAEIEKLHVLWFNEPCPPSSLGVFRKIAAESVTPIGLGKSVTEGGSVLDLLREDAVDIIRPDIGLNGITQIRRMAAIAEVYYVAVGPVHNGGPIGTAAALHLAASIPNFFIQEMPFPEAEEDQAMRLSLTTEPVEVIQEGFAVLPTGPGLGINVNEQNLEKYKEVAL